MHTIRTQDNAIIEHMYLNAAPVSSFSPKALNFNMKTLEAKAFFFQFKIIINVLVSSFQFIWRVYPRSVWDNIFTNLRILPATIELMCHKILLI